MFNTLKRRFCVKIFYDWHSNYHKWMRSIAKSDLKTLQKELGAIKLQKLQDVNNEFYEYELDMLNGQEAILERLIKEIKR